jgi:heptosyltransferase-1
MPRVLLVKTSSLGDVVHNLPVASDIASQVPGVSIDWVVEEAFASVPALHGSVAGVIPVAVRRWRSAALDPATWREARAFVARLRSIAYDAVIDTQGLLKSAIIAKLSRGARYGLDWRSSREPLFVFYDRTMHVPRTQHAVERNRSLAAQALAYDPPARIEYGIGAAANVRAPGQPRNYAVLVHATSAPEKLWPEERWAALGHALARDGLTSVLPWGDDGERRRAERLAAAIPGAQVPQRLPLAEVVSLLAGARAVVGLDTGLTHLSGALGVPTVGVYTATDPGTTGLFGCARAVNLGRSGAIPEVEEVLQALRALPP